jgi:AcrR family transcriptional regulator
VLKRAELSNGALWRHFRSKAELMVAAALWSEERIAAWPVDSKLDRLAPAERLDRAVEQFWRHAHDTEFQALIELLAASRSDPELAGLLAEADARAGSLFFEAFARLAGPELAGREDFQRNARLLGLTLYGVGLTAGLRPTVDERRLLGEVRAMVRRLFDL